MSMRKHGLEVVHADYRRESFHCEHALQSLMEIEGENTPGAPPSPPDQTPTHTHTPAQLTMSLVRQLGRQDSIAGRESEGKGRQPDSSEAVLRIASKTQLRATTLDPKSIQSGEPPQEKKVASKSESSQVISTGKEAPRDAGKSESIYAIGSSLKIPEETPVVQSYGAQELNPHSFQTDGPKGLEKGKEIGKIPVKEKTAPTMAPDVNKSSKGPLNIEGTGSISVGATKVSEAVPAKSKTIEERVQTPSGLARGPQEERYRREAAEESPASPSPTARSPSASKSRAVSPGERSSFVMQLTSVAKTVLGPMKLGSQDGGKAKDSSKTNEDKRAATLGKSEASSGSRRGLTGTWPGPGSSKPEKPSKSSSKHS